MSFSLCPFTFTAVNLFVQCIHGAKSSFLLLNSSFTSPSSTALSIFCFCFCGAPFSKTIFFAAESKLHGMTRTESSSEGGREQLMQRWIQMISWLWHKRPRNELDLHLAKSSHLDLANSAAEEEEEEDSPSFYSHAPNPHFLLENHPHPRLSMQAGRLQSIVDT